MQHQIALQNNCNGHSLLTGLILALALLLTPHFVQAAPDDDNSARLERVNQDIEELRTLLKKIRKERSTIETRLENTEKEISRVQRNLRKTEAQLKEARETEKKQRAERQALKKQQITTKQAVAQAIKAAYMAGQNPGLKIALNQENPAKAGRMMVYYNHFAQAQSDSLLALKESDRKLAIIEQQLDRTNQQIASRRQSLNQQAEQLKSSLQNRRQTLARLNSSENQNHSSLSRLEQERGELQKLLSSILSIADITEVDRPFRQLRGKLNWPVKGPVIHRFGEKRQNTKMTWDGVFIKASSGTAVTTPHHGRVVFSDWMKSFGQLLIIDHGNGYMTLYAHNQELLKTEGDWVLPGEHIARVGDSGGQIESGLYFEVRHKGQPSNPMTWLVASR